MCKLVSCEEYTQEKPPKQSKIQNIDKQNITEPSTTTSI